jgi:hypothetical protein
VNHPIKKAGHAAASKVTPTGRSTRTRSGIAPPNVLVSVRMVAQCRSVPVNANVNFYANSRAFAFVSHHAAASGCMPLVFS